MILRDTDIKWMASNFPELSYLPADRCIVGSLHFCAAFDKETGQLKLGYTEDYRAISSFLCEKFEVRFDLERIHRNGWPSVYEVGGRSFEIARRNRCRLIDLHFYEDGTCCLGLNYAVEKYITLKRFTTELVIPFFYRLAYTDRYGLTAVKRNLWGEYSHGESGIREYEVELQRIATKEPSRNELCSCGSGLKYKRCHLAEVEAYKRRIELQLSGNDLPN